MMLRLLLTLILLTIFQACQVEEKVSSAKQINDTTTNSSNYIVTLPQNGWKKLNDTIAVSLMLAHPITVTGNPYIDVTIGWSSERLYYVSGSGSNVITFSYTVGSFDIDEDGIQFSNMITLNGGTITLSTGSGAIIDAPLTFDVPTNLIKVDGVVPTVMTMTPPNAGNYVTGNWLNYYLSFSEKVFVTGVPSFNLNMNSGAVPANYRGGSGTNILQFQRLVAAGDIDTTGFTSSTLLSLSSPTITIKDQAGNVFNSNIPATITLPDVAGTNSILTGTVVPPVGLGSDGDSYFNSTTGITYLKSGGIWTASTQTYINVTVPTIVSVTAPGSGSYVAGSNLDFSVTWSQAVNVTGTPGIAVSLTTGTVFANYISGSGTATHTYRLTVQAGQVDYDGISLASFIDLRGSTIKNLTGTTNASLFFTPPSTVAILVDAGNGPAIIAVTPPNSGYFLAGQNIDFAVTFNRDVIVTGSPSIPVVVGATTYQATYNSGSGSSILIFRYTVGANHNDNDGITLTSPIQLNGGDIEDASAKNAILVFNTPATNNHKVDALAPSIVNIVPQNTGLFRPGQTVDFKVFFSEDVIVTGGSPQLELDVGGTTRYAQYIPGSSGSNYHIYRYTPVAGDLDTNGIDLVSPIDDNSAILKDARGNSASLNFVPAATFVNVDGVAAGAISVAHSGNASYGIGDIIEFTLTWNESVVVSGNPRLALTVGLSTVYADYYAVGSSATVTKFRYTVVTGQQDTDGLTMSGVLDTTLGNIKDVMNNTASSIYTPPVTTGLLVDGIRPTIIGVNSPVPGNYHATDVLTFTLTWSEPVTFTGAPYLQIQIGSNLAIVAYQAGSSTATSSVFSYTLPTGLMDTNGINLLNAIIMSPVVSIRDAADNDAVVSLTPPNLSTVLIDTIQPTIATIAGPEPRVHVYSETLDFQVFWSEPVSVTGVPYIEVDVGGTFYFATYESSLSTPTKSVFRYTVGLNHLDTDGITITSPIQFNMGDSIQDLYGNAADIAFVPPDMSNVTVDGVKPLIVSITPPANTTYLVGANLDFTVNWSHAMTVDDSGGKPRIQLILGSTSVWAEYESGSGTSSTVFRYTVVAGDEDLNGVQLISPVQMNGGIIEGPTGNTPFDNFTTTTYSGVKVDAKAPDYVSGTTTKYAYNSATGYRDMDYQLNYSEPIVVAGGTPSFQITINATTYNAVYVSGTGTSTLTFRYTLSATDSLLDMNGVTVNPTINLNGATMKDAVGHNAPTAFTWTRKHYVHYSNIIARYKFSSDFVNTVTCGVGSCINYVVDISGKNASFLYSPAPSDIRLQSPFASGSESYAKFNSGYLQGPTLSNVAYVTIVLKHSSNLTSQSLLKDSNSTSYITFSSTGGRLYMSHRFNFRRNASSLYSSTTSNPFYYTGAWGINVQSILQIQNATPFFPYTNYNSIRLGNGFDGQLAEIIFWSSSVNLESAGRATTLINQLNSMYGAY